MAICAESMTSSRRAPHAVGNWDGLFERSVSQQEINETLDAIPIELGGRTANEWARDVSELVCKDPVFVDAWERFRSLLQQIIGATDKRTSIDTRSGRSMSARDRGSYFEQALGGLPMLMTDEQEHIGYVYVQCKLRLQLERLSWKLSEVLPHEHDFYAWMTVVADTAVWLLMNDPQFAAVFKKGRREALVAVDDMALGKLHKELGKLTQGYHQARIRSHL